MSNNVLIIAGFALRESVRRRVFVVVALLTVGFLVLYALGVWQIAKESDVDRTFDGIDGEVVVAATIPTPLIARRPPRGTRPPATSAAP